MNVSRVNKKIEAIKRMEVLDLNSEVIRQFEEDGLVNCSWTPLCANYWLADDQMEIVREFEKEYNALVYFATYSITNFGKLTSFLYVSDYEEEWEMDNGELKDGYVYAYVYNHNFPEYSEIGLIKVQRRFGGLVRIG